MAIQKIVEWLSIFIIVFFLYQCFKVWWSFNKYICLGIVGLIFLTLWLGIQ